MNTDKSMIGDNDKDILEIREDTCSPHLAARLAAMLNRPATDARAGCKLPRGWHVIMFNRPTLQSQLRPDGTADQSVPLPDLGLPRLMFGGRQTAFNGDMPIGAQARRVTRQKSLEMKEGRSGRLGILTLEHQVFLEGGDDPTITELQTLILRPLEKRDSASPNAAQPSSPTEHVRRTPDNTIVPDEMLLFRYSSITDNPHRIHYDRAYATREEGYPELIVNGSIPTMFLLELFRNKVNREPESFSSRNISPMYCGHPLALFAERETDSWHLWAEDEHGRLTFDAWAK